MCVLYGSFGSNVRTRTFWCVAMCSAVLFILRSRLLVYAAERRGMGVYEVSLYMSLLCFGMGTMLANFHMGGIMLLLRNMLARNGVVVSVMLYPCMFSVALSMDLFVLCVACLTVFVNCFFKPFAICLGMVVILLLNVMVLFSVVGGALLDIPCMVFQRVCVLCL